eukprot:gene29495-36557_t
MKGNTGNSKVKGPILRVNDRNAVEPATDLEKRQRDEEIELEACFVNPFWCNEETIVLPKNVNGAGTSMAIRIASKNTGFEKAFTQLTDTRIKNPNKRIKARAIFQNLISSPVVNDETGQSNYVIDFTQNYFQFRKPISLKAGVYQNTCMVVGRDNPFDIRVIDITAKVDVPDAKMVLEFKEDRSRHPHHERVAEGLEPKTLLVPKGSSSPTMLEIIFIGSFSGTFEGNLQLRNPDGNDVFDYTLIGTAEDPLSEDNLAFQCKARERKTCSIRLEQIPRPQPSGNNKGSTGVRSETQRLEVESDLPYVTSAETVEVGLMGATYNFVVQSPMGGVFTGSMTFRDVETGAIMWYTISIEVTAPAEEKTITVEATVRQAVVVDITLNNPTDDILLFDVFVYGEGLLGDTVFELAPRNSRDSNDTYELIYSPLLTGNFTGRISFNNDRVGELWYKLNLVALPATPIVLETVEAMLGTSKSVSAPLDNPLAESVVFSVKIEDSEHFYVTSTQVEAPLGEANNNKSPVYKSNPGGGASHNRNMPQNNVIDTSSPTKQAAPAFGLLMKRTTDHVIAAKALFQIALSFSPIILGAYDATVQIRSTVNGRSLLWCYPVVGIAEAGTALRLPTIKTPCKTSFLKEVEIPLEGIRRSEVLSASDLLTSDFTLETNYEDKVKGLVMRTFRVQLIDAIALPEDTDPDTFYAPGKGRVDYAMRCRFLFEPLRTFNTRVEVVLVYKNKGKWRVNVDLEATEPEPDDRIKLCAAVGAQDKVAFKLNNRFLGFSNFQAYFTAKSSPHFSVSPSTGVLAPYGAEGTPFTVTFSPKVYGNIEIGTLVILTEDAQWNYEVRGSYPDTTLNNNNIRSKVDTNRGTVGVTVNGSYTFQK